jgi:flavin-dependent dehydrogenase
LHPGIEPLLDSLGVKDNILAAGFLRHAGHKVKWGEADPELIVTYGQDSNGRWQAFQAWRDRFDMILMNRAKQIGVCVMQPCRVRRVLTQQRRVCGVDTDLGQLNANFVIDAAGDRHWLAKQLRLTVNQRSPFLSADYGYVLHAASSRSLPKLEATKDGWTWIAPAKLGVWSWTRLSFCRKPGGEGPPECFRFYEATERSGGANVTWRQVRPAAGPGYFIVGDAAVVLDPASSHGVLRAIMSGIMAANTIVRIRRGFSETAAMRNFVEWISNWFNHDLETLTALYRSHPSRPSWRFGRNLISRNSLSGARKNQPLTRKTRALP